MKSFLLKLPEYVLLIIALLAGYSPPFSIHPIFIGIAVLLILQIIFKNRISGIILGILFSLANLFFFGALISEFSEFTEFNDGAQQLVFVGLPLLSMSMLLSLTMIYKYSVIGMGSRSSHKNQSI